MKNSSFNLKYKYKTNGILNKRECKLKRGRSLCLFAVLCYPGEEDVIDAPPGTLFSMFAFDLSTIHFKAQTEVALEASK